MRKTVLFLGAGFSFDADLPIMSAFAEASDLKQFRLPQLDRELAEPFTRSARVYQEFRQLLVDRRALSGLDANNIEAVYCAAEALRESSSELVHLPSGALMPHAIVDEIARWIWKVYHQLPFYNPDRNAQLDTYSHFIRAIEPFGSDITVLSTNYDIVFEWSAHLGGMECAYPLTAAQPVSVGSGSRHFVALGKENGDSRVPVLKLHGSINYFTPFVDSPQVHVATNVSDGGPINGHPFRADIPSVVAVDSLVDVRSNGGIPRAEPCIVPPGYSKFVTDGWLRETWAAALRAVSSAQRLIFVGYSLPPTDGLLRSMFVAALGVRVHPDPIEVLVLDPDDTGEVQRRAEAVFGFPNVTHEKVCVAQAADAVGEWLGSPKTIG